MQSDAASMQQRSKSIKPKETPIEEPVTPIEIEKDSLQLGIAAGFTGRSLRNIEDSLVRIEAQMVTKDWMELTVKADLASMLVRIQSSLDSIAGSASGLPPAMRQNIMSQVERIRAELQPTSRMMDIITAVREAKELSYEDLAAKVGIEVPSLRGLLSQMAKRTSLIERFERGNKGWVRYREPIEAMQSAANSESKEKSSSEGLEEAKTD